MVQGGGTSSMHGESFQTPLDIPKDLMTCNAICRNIQDWWNLHNPNSLLKFENFSWVKGFVKISTIYFSALIKIN